MLCVITCLVWKKQKTVNAGDPILPVQMLRGYDGVAILWKKYSDHRFQCVETQIQNLVIVIVYMPCKVLRDIADDFDDCLAQLHEIIQKYTSTLMIFVGVILIRILPRPVILEGYAISSSLCRIMIWR